MANWLGRLGFGVILLAVPAGAAAQELMVRGSAPELASAIADASQQSATFRRMVDAVAAAGGLVYVHHGTCGRNVLACLVLNIKKAGPFRVLSIRVDKRKKGRNLMVAIGHELQHVLEVLNEPGAVDADTIRIFYERTAPTERLSFETQAAIEIELKIDGELRAYAGAIR